MSHITENDKRLNGQVTFYQVILYLIINAFQVCGVTSDSGDSVYVAYHIRAAD